jgi:hypothetical protein
VEVTKQTCAKDELVKKGWFIAVSDVLKPLVVARNETSKKLKENSTQANNKAFRTT